MGISDHDVIYNYAGAKGSLSKTKSFYMTGKCPGHPSLNFLDPQDLYLEISMAGKFKYNPLLFFFF